MKGKKIDMVIDTLQKHQINNESQTLNYQPIGKRKGGRLENNYRRTI